MPILFLFLLKLHFYSAGKTSCGRDLPLGPAHGLPDGPSQVAGRGKPSHARKNCASHSGSGPEALGQAPQRPAKMEELYLLKQDKIEQDAEHLSMGLHALLLQGLSLSHPHSPSQPLLMPPTPLLAFSCCTISPEGGTSGFAYFCAKRALSNPSLCPQPLPLTLSTHLSGLRLYVTSARQSSLLLRLAGLCSVLPEDSVFTLMAALSTLLYHTTV